MTEATVMYRVSTPHYEIAERALFSLVRRGITATIERTGPGGKYVVTGTLELAPVSTVLVLHG